MVKTWIASNLNVFMSFSLEKCSPLSSLGNTLLFSYKKIRSRREKKKHLLLIRHELFLIYTQCLIPGFTEMQIVLQKQYVNKPFIISRQHPNLNIKFRTNTSSLFQRTCWLKSYPELYRNTKWKTVWIK